MELDFRIHDWGFYWQSYEHLSREYKRHYIGFGPFHLVIDL